MLKQKNINGKKRLANQISEASKFICLGCHLDFIF
ncbi:hypothetical protein BN440_2326 [Erwinia amylovora MR1]|nr:hypothetical protein BN440_2326 [Erwinia amylovora MR1]